MKATDNRPASPPSRKKAKVLAAVGGGGAVVALLMTTSAAAPAKLQLKSFCGMNDTELSQGAYNAVEMEWNKIKNKHNDQE